MQNSWELLWYCVRTIFSLGSFQLLTVTALVVAATGNGTFGLHKWDFPVSQLLSDRNLITTALLPWLTPLTLGLVKTTIFLTYMEIFRSIKWMRMACLISLSFTVLWYFSITIAALCLAIPLGGGRWVKHLFTAHSVIVASIMSVVYCAIHGSEYGDNTWWLVPIISVTITETLIGFIMACAWHFSKFLRTYEEYFLRAGSILANLFCCRCKVSRGKNSAEPKSSEAPDTLDDLKMSGSKVSREKVKLPPKMYPGLDFTSRGGTVPATELDKNENIPNSKENHKVDSNMEHAQVEKDPTIGENEILPTR
ncbi:uncharacterized protein EAF01_002082 [Botrytis porri]|uniref:uncharacterized protein n=1 Tax=Botrytis porri TaxID=87229 RepID=UPI0018FFE9B3|nr:uncharacterized protein EAF01_002082 [Botrytis porri]KAF7913061.1 hypothetical protein EAF01_002082 [Botrytis porri]